VELVGLVDYSLVRDGVRILDRLSWSACSGERWVVLGSNGAGKTTLLHVLAEQARCDLVGLVAELPIPPQESALDVVVSGAFGRFDRSGEVWERVEAERASSLLAQLGCRAIANRHYGALSEGERRRVLIARALMPDPELLLLDEPAGGLDLAGREALVHWLNRLSADPRAPVTVLVTHHVEEIPPATTHALLLRAGRAVAQGPVAETLTGPALSRCFGLPVRCERWDGRWTARLATEA
jgi:iron complex transport system ATP-binding protein